MGTKSRCHFERRCGAQPAENCGSLSAASKQQVPRLRKIVRLANDLASLGMTGLWRQASKKTSAGDGMPRA
jgi:hypothetical protein